MKLVIHVDGGNVQGVYVDTSKRGSTTAVVVDADNLETEGYSKDQIDDILSNETEGCTELALSDPKADNKCDACGDMFPLIVGSPTGEEVCVQCFDQGVA
jgi:hypothetical protein